MTDGRFFQTTKRGELHELKEQLHSANKDKKKGAVKKVIAAMTVGKDVSGLFPDVVNCMQTSNIELKKLVYLYVINYAKAQPELAILAVNTFRKDSLDTNPLIRALAVRTMGCIRLDQITEYLVEPLRRCCKDQDPYVRKTAAICIAKLYDISPDLVEDQGFIDILKEMLSDGNPMVVANSVASLSEISESSGRNFFAMNDTTIPKLLTALNECTEWGQVFILDALANYNPTSSRDAESILERITARLSHANAAVVMSAIKVVMKFLDKVTNQESARALQRKLSPPLVTLLSAEPEIQYVALRNINLIVQARPHILANEVKMFFCKYNDPVYVKMEKLDIMVRLVSEKNVDQILLEFKEYATEIDVDFVRKSVQAIGRCAIKLDRAAERCINVLLDLLMTRVNYVVQEGIVVIKDIFRKYPNRYESIISALCENLDSLDEAEAKAAMVWIIGEYAERVDNADELLATFLESFHDEPTAVQLQILTATVKLFLKAPANNQDMITQVLKMSTDETENPDLRDRGFIYWRLLSSDPEATKEVVLADKPTISDISYSLDPSVLDRLIDNISMLASVYHKLPESFVARLHNVKRDNEYDDDDEDETSDRVARMREEMQDRPEYESEEDDDRNRSGVDQDDGSSAADATDLLGLDDDSFNAPPPTTTSVQVNQSVLVPPGHAGQKGEVGLQIAGAIYRSRGRINLRLTFANTSQASLSGFAIQFNKNPFGLGAVSNLKMSDVPPGQNCETDLPLNPNQLLSQTAPSAPLMLQVAVKCSLDIFYFNVPMDFAVVLTEAGALEREAFKQKWTIVGESQQAAIMTVATEPLQTQQVVKLLEAHNIFLVAERPADTFMAMFVSCTTTNDIVVMGEIYLRKGAPEVKVVARTEAGPLIPLFHSQVSKILSLQVKA